MQRTPSKPCTYCESLTHYPFQCYKNPYLKKFGWKGSKSPQRRAGLKPGVNAKLWDRARRTWFIDNMAEHYTCHYCGKRLLPYETTLDHMEPRSLSPHLRYEQKNLVPSCWSCNVLKGSTPHSKYVHTCH